jgi:hypothetical protein
LAQTLEAARRVQNKFLETTKKDPKTEKRKKSPPQNDHCIKEASRFKILPIRKRKIIFAKNPYAPPQVNNQ